MNETETQAGPAVELHRGTVRPRHIVELDRETGQYQDRTLCGELWDRLHPGHNGSICQECVDEQRRRPRWEDE